MTEELATVSISCTPIRSKPRLSFPLLDLKKMDPEEKEMLHQRLFAESEDMTYKFQQLFNKTRKSLVVRRISVDNLLKYLDCLGSSGTNVPRLWSPCARLPAAWTKEDRKCGQGHVRDQLLLLFLQLSHSRGDHQQSWNWTRQDKPQELPGGVQRVRSATHIWVSIRTWRNEWHRSCQDDCHTGCNIWKLHGQPSLCLCQQLAEGTQGTNRVITSVSYRTRKPEDDFQLPHSVQQAIFPLSSEQKEALSGLGVVQLSCGDYQFTRHENEVTPQACV